MNSQYPHAPHPHRTSVLHRPRSALQPRRALRAPAGRAGRRRLVSGGGPRQHRDDADARAGPGAHHEQRFARRSVREVDQSLSGVQSCVHLLLRATQSRLHGTVARSGLRDSYLLQAGRGARAGRATSASELRLQADYARRQHRSLSARREPHEGHALDSRGVCAHPSPGDRHHQGARSCSAIWTCWPTSPATAW